MPDATAKINHDQRTGLYELVRNHLGSVEELFNALEREKDIAKAERLALDLREDFDLLDDLGWDPDEERESYELTMSPHDLMEVLKRLHDEAGEVLQGSSGERQSREEDAETQTRFLHGQDACEQVLIELAARTAGEQL